MDIFITKEHPEILAEGQVGYGRKWLSAYKSYNISEMQQDRTNVAIDGH